MRFLLNLGEVSALLPLRVKKSWHLRQGCMKIHRLAWVEPCFSPLLLSSLRCMFSSPSWAVSSCFTTDKLGWHWGDIKSGHSVLIRGTEGHGSGGRVIFPWEGLTQKANTLMWSCWSIRACGSSLPKVKQWYWQKICFSNIHQTNSKLAV